MWSGRPSWPGAERRSPPRLHITDHSTLAMKEAALRCVDDPAPQPLRFTAGDRLLDFLEAL